MKRSLPILTALVVAASLTPKALPMYDTHTFSSKARPRVSYDAGTHTWTLTNEAILRSVRFDSRTGGLLPVKLTLNGRNAAAKVISEGSLTLVAPLSGAPQAIAKGWRFTEEKPGDNWAGAGFDDSGWEGKDLPFTTKETNRSWWFRYRIPAGRLRPGRSYAVVLDHSADDGAEIWADGARIGSLPATALPWTKTYQFPLPNAAKVIAIRLDGGGQPNGLKNISIAEAAGERTLDLSRGWALAGHREGADTATISLKGVGSNKGFRVDVRYRVMPGDEPIVTKRVSLRNPSGSALLIKEVFIDELECRSAITGKQALTGSGLAVATANGAGMVTSPLGLQGSSEVTGRRVRIAYRPFTPAGPSPNSTPEAAIGLYNGPTAKGAYLLQLYVGRHVAHGSPTTVPPLYSTWFGYYNTIDAALVESLVPRAAELGVRYFAVDDGWQAINGGSVRGYGDWVANPTFFPDGLKPIADKVRAYGMEFGLWTAPIMVHNQSAVSLNHPEWKIRYADGSGKPLWDGTTAECFSGAYAKHFQETLLGLCKSLNLKFLKLDGGLYEDGCVDAGHGHPVAHSEGAQVAAWKDLCATLRKEVPGVIIDRGWEGEPGLTALHDTSWYGDWILAFHPEREADIRWWYRNADNYRRFLYSITASRPPFTISWEAPCHILAKSADLDALEYHLTSIGAYVCNLEIHGRILEMTPEEATVTRKWVKWNWENRTWLAVTQPLTTLGQPYDPMTGAGVPHVDGVMHLRNAVRGRYGYVCLWNPSDKPAAADVLVRPDDYFLKMDTSKVVLRRVKDGTAINASATTHTLEMHVPMGPLSWEIVEVRARP